MIYHTRIPDESQVLTNTPATGSMDVRFARSGSSCSCEDKLPKTRRRNVGMKYGYSNASSLFKLR